MLAESLPIVPEYLHSMAAHGLMQGYLGLLRRVLQIDTCLVSQAHVVHNVVVQSQDQQLVPDVFFEVGASF